MTEPVRTIVRGLASHLSPEEVRSIFLLRGAVDREAFLTGHVLLRWALAEALDRDPSEFAFSRHPCPACHSHVGRPFLPAFPNVAFSLTHTRGLVAVAVASVAVGVDIEPANRNARFLVRGLHPREQRELSCLRGRALQAATVKCWVRKEAWLKASGIGVAHGVDQPYVGTGVKPCAPTSWEIHDLALPLEYVGAVAAASGTKAVLASPAILSTATSGLPLNSVAKSEVVADEMASLTSSPVRGDDTPTLCLERGRGDRYA